jgi:hypothetical protein
MTNTVKITPPVSPSSVLSCHEVDATKFTVTYGGGMGGSCATLYALDYHTDKVAGQDVYVVTLLDGSTEEINAHYVARKKATRLVEQLTDATAWYNHSAIKCKEHKIHEFYELEVDETWDRVNGIAGSKGTIYKRQYTVV